MKDVAITALKPIFGPRLADLVKHLEREIASIVAEYPAEVRKSWESALWLGIAFRAQLHRTAGSAIKEGADIDGTARMLFWGALAAQGTEHDARKAEMLARMEQVNAAATLRSLEEADEDETEPFFGTDAEEQAWRAQNGQNFKPKTGTA